MQTLFTTRKGRPFQGLGSSHFKKLQRDAGLPEQCSYDLRHACTKSLLAQGLPPRVATGWLGHSQISLTMNTYSHVMPAAKDDAAQSLQKLLA